MPACFTRHWREFTTEDAAKVLVDAYGIGEA